MFLVDFIFHFLSIYFDICTAPMFFFVTGALQIL